MYMTDTKRTKLIQKKKQTSVLNDDIHELRERLSMTLQEARNDISRFVFILDNYQSVV